MLLLEDYVNKKLDEMRSVLCFNSSDYNLILTDL